MEEKINYSLELNKFLKYSVWGTPLLAILVIIVSLIDVKITGKVLIVLIPFLGFALWNWFKYFKRPVKIDVYEDFALFYNILKKKTKIMFRDIRAIESSNTQALIIRTRSKEILGVNGFSGFSKFVEDIKSKNSEIILKGL